ncbi:MAG: EAL domain-containing protein [Gammaproteobacteria bacterium]|nr:EAL domain-containing protein [Gammaproteobacteria bacterium]
MSQLLDQAQYAFHPLSVPHFATAGIVAAAGLMILLWERGSRVSRMFGAFSAIFTLWAVLRGLIRCAVDADAALLLGRYLYAVVALGAPLLLQFITVMLRTEAQQAFVIGFAWVTGALFAVATLATDWVVAGTVVYRWGLEPSYGLFGGVLVLWLFGLVAVALSDVHRAFRRTLPATVEHRRVRLFGVAVVSLSLTLVDFLAAFGLPVYPVGFVTVLVFMALTAYLTRRYGLVEVTEQLAAREIAALTRGALLVLDQDGVIRVMNERTSETLGLRRENAVGRRAAELLGAAFAVDSLGMLAGLEDADAEKVLIYEHPVHGEARDLALSVVAVRDARRHAVAYACALRDVTDQRHEEREQLSEGLKDPLTGLPNRTMFLALLDAVVERARKSPQYRFAVFVIGLDRMRRINEDLGFAAGDRVLAELSARLRLVARPQDAVARVGGDEFGVLMRRYDSPDEVRELAMQLRKALDLPIALGDQQVYLTVRVGVATGEHTHADGSELFRNASIAMFRAKEQGHDVHFMTSGDTVQQRVRIESDLRRALQRGELRVFYQPIVDLRERRVSGFEALVRWQHPGRGLLLPDDFIEVAEDVGLIVALDQFVMRQACSDLALIRREAGDPGYSVNVNLSEGMLRDPELLAHVGRCLAEGRLSPSALRAELVEQVAQIEPVRETLARLRELGLGLYVDDFGSGYSALGRLHQMPASGIKIDRSMVRALSQGEGGAKVVGGIVALARSLGLEVVAEGCGTADEVVRLRQLGCHRMQGFYFAKGLPLEELVPLLRSGALAERAAELERVAGDSAWRQRAVAAWT